MRVGDLIIAEDIICRVEKVTSDRVEAWVINGAWEITFSRIGMPTLCHHPTGPLPIDTHILAVVPAELWPSKLGYNKIYDWVKEWFEKPAPVRWFLSWQRRAINLRDRFNQSMKAFLKVWRDEGEEDDFPF